MSVLAAVAMQRSGLAGSGLASDGVRIVAMPASVQRVLGRRVQAITLRRTVMVNPRLFDSLVAGQQPELLAHELIHVGQWTEMGVVPFLVSYLSDYLRLRMLGVDHNAAYRGIGFEHAAYRGAAAIAEK